jgi:hypothetical protein
LWVQGEQVDVAPELYQELQVQLQNLVVPIFKVFHHPVVAMDQVHQVVEVREDPVGVEDRTIHLDVEMIPQNLCHKEIQVELDRAHLLQRGVVVAELAQEMGPIQLHLDFLVT